MEVVQGAKMGHFGATMHGAWSLPQSEHVEGLHVNLHVSLWIFVGFMDQRCPHPASNATQARCEIVRRSSPSSSALLLANR